MRHLASRQTLLALAVSITIAGCGTSVTAPSLVPTAAAPTAAAPSTSTSPATPSPAPSTPPTTPPSGAARWLPAGSLQLGRSTTHAVPIANGQVLVVGDDNICTPGGAWAESVEAELFDPSAGTWAPTGNLNAPRDAFVAVGMPDGRVLVAGGLTSGDPADSVFGAYSSAKLFEPETGRWSATGAMNVARTEPAAALLPDGTALVAGGAYIDATDSRVLSSAEIYDAATGAWARTGDMTVARRSAQAVTLSDGRVLVVGGSGPTVDEPSTLPSAEIFDPASGTWSSVGSLAAPRRAFVLAALPDGGALVAGGLVETGDGSVTTAATERLDPKTGTWSATGAMLRRASNRSAISLGDGRVLAAGGMAAQPGEGPSDGSDVGRPAGAPAIADAELYDPATGIWSAATPLPEGRARGSLVTLPDGSVLLVGGDAGYLGEPSAPWCPAPIAATLRYVPGDLAGLPTSSLPPAAEVAKADIPRAAARPADAKKAAASITAFGIDLYRRMLADPGLGLAKRNAVFSPTSIALALGMARAGARGNTAAQVDTVLHTAGWDLLGSGLNALDQALASRDAAWRDEEGKQHVLVLRIANAAFAQRAWTIVQEYLDAIAAAFGAGVRLVDYQADPEAARVLINAWVKQQTADRIPELIPQGIIDPVSRLVLVNAISLEANWEIEFAQEEIGEPTTPRRFTRLDGSVVTVPTMSLHGGQIVPYASGPGWKATELRYLGANGSAPLAMTLVVPNDLAEFEKGLAPSKLAGVIAKLDRQRTVLDRVTSSGEDMDCGTYAYQVHLFMPRFGIDTNALLKDVLTASGMPLAFDPFRADFTGIHEPDSPADRIHVANVIHQANIDVDEKGTTAAAATAVVMATGGCTGPEPSKTVTVRLDRPFLFVLRDVETGAILFMGRVVDPSVR